MNAAPAVRKNLREQKFDFAYERVIQGMKYMQIVREFAMQFDDTERNAKNYIKKVNEHLANPAPQERNKALNKARAQYEDLYGKLYEQGKYKEAADVRAKIDRLEGLDRVIIEQNVTSNQPQLDLSALPLEVLLQLQAHLPGNAIDVQFTEVGKEFPEDPSEQEESE
ncbi:hypothetical protein [uncultured Pontibacter sp.]|uniref:hypothetical protein n=1 Tax=uncultured Pontibacter sp. TaxID=453356 RepID=UPI00260A926C|nr:hypothetical protein [uncultured Pontibacter sp.]